MKYCVNCGTKMADDAKFCKKCGSEQFNSGTKQLDQNQRLTTESYHSNLNVNFLSKQFIQNNPVLFLVIEWGMLAVADFIPGFLIAIILANCAIIGGYNYISFNPIHGRIMVGVGILLIICEFILL